MSPLSAGLLCPCLAQPFGVGELGTKGWEPSNQPSCARRGSDGGARGGPVARMGRAGCALRTGAVRNNECRPFSCSDHLRLSLPQTSFLMLLSGFFRRLGVSPEGKNPQGCSRHSPAPARVSHHPTLCQRDQTQLMTHLPAPTEVTEGTGHRVIPQAPS